MNTLSYATIIERLTLLGADNGFEWKAGKTKGKNRFCYYGEHFAGNIWVRVKEIRTKGECAWKVARHLDTNVEEWRDEDRTLQEGRIKSDLLTAAAFAMQMALAYAERR